MGFWKENSVSPKRNYRFRVQFGRRTDGGGLSDSQHYWWAKTMKVPSFTINSVEHDYLDNKYHFPGRTVWEDVNMSLVDPSSPDAVQIILDMLRLSGYKVKGQSDTVLMTIGKIKASGVDCIMTMLDENGAVIEEWTLNNCFILSADLGEYDYSSDDLRQLSVTLKYDWATCQIGAASGTEYFPAASTSTETGTATED